jgi:hypothetical protein
MATVPIRLGMGLSRCPTPRPKALLPRALSGPFFCLPGLKSPQTHETWAGVRHKSADSTLMKHWQASNIKADSTLRSSQAVPHPSTNRALCRLTSEVERDPVLSTWYGRQRNAYKCKGLNTTLCISNTLQLFIPLSFKQALNLLCSLSFTLNLWDSGPGTTSHLSNRPCIAAY